MNETDIQTILEHRYDQGWDYWTTEDRRLGKGAPFSCLESAEYLLELGMNPQEEILQKVAELLWESWREPGEFRLYPKGAVFPCQTIPAATLLVRLGHEDDPRMKQTLKHLLTTRYEDGGWWCKKFYFGKGPCHYGIGTLFMQVEYPFRGYNLFYYLYVLSFYKKARNDQRFKEAFKVLQEKTVADQIVVERVVPKLRKLNFCKKDQVSLLATERYQEILTNIAE